MVLIFFYVILLVLGGAYVSNQMGKDKEDSHNWQLLVLPLTLIAPLLTLFLAKYYGDGEFDIAKAGPVGDWLSGSTVPFLTFATFIVAIAAFNSSRTQLDIVREGTKQQNEHSEHQLKLAQESVNQQKISFGIQRFESTFFLLIDELKKMNEVENRSLISEAYEQFKRACYIEEEEQEKRIKIMTRESRQGKEIGELEIYREMYNRYYDSLDRVDYPPDYFQIQSYVWKVLGLVIKNKSILDDPDFYIDFIQIHVDERTVLLMLYRSLQTISVEGGGYDLLKHSGIMEILKYNSHAVDPATDYRLFDYIYELEDRRKIDKLNDVFDRIKEKRNNV